MDNRQRIKIKRKYFGDEFLYYAYLTYKSKQCQVRQACFTEEQEGTISDDLKHIILSRGFKVEGMNEEKPKTIFKLKIPKVYQPHVKDAVNG